MVKMMWCPFCQSSKPFLKWHLKICTSMILKPRNLKMADSKIRQESFITNSFPISATTCSTDLANCGFYALADGETLSCFFCNVRIRNLDIDDDPIERHLNEYPKCMFIIDLCDNISLCNYCNKLVPEPKTKPIKYISKHEDRCFETAVLTRNKMGQFPSNPRMTEISARIKTFKKWTRKDVCAKKLAEAGFYMSGKENNMACFYCDGIIDDWTFEENPFETHVKKFPECKFANGSLETNDEIVLIEENQSDDPKLCKICWTNDKNVVFENCGHMLTCETCASKLNKCPVCRQPISRAIRVFIS